LITSWKDFHEALQARKIPKEPTYTKEQARVLNRQFRKKWDKEIKDQIKKKRQYRKGQSI
jgi:hypothetical protein